MNSDGQNAEASGVLLAHHGTRGQAAFFLATRGRNIDEVEARDALARQAITAVTAAIPIDWRRGKVERDDLSRFLFAPDDTVVVVGQDGLVANVAKYFDGQPASSVSTPTRPAIPASSSPTGRLTPRTCCTPAPTSSTGRWSRPPPTTGRSCAR